MEKEIITWKGKKKILHGNPRSLVLREDVFRSFERVRKANKKKTFHGISAIVAAEHNISRARVDQIVRHDYELPNWRTNGRRN